MSVRRLIVLLVLCFLIFLGIYTWNARTGKWDAFGAHVGLEVSGLVLRVVTSVNDTITNTWNRYWYLVDVEAENEILHRELNALKLQTVKASEDAHELSRLRKMLSFKNTGTWERFGARILAWRLGSNSYLESVVLSKGYYNGAKVGTPITTPDGLMGRVLKAGPYTSIALLISDPGSSVAVVTSENRVPGIAQGNGPGNLLTISFVKQNQTVFVGELLVSSGMDLNYPKGIAVARVVSVELGADAMFTIKAKPLVDFESVEEVFLLQNPYESILPQGSPVYSPKSPQYYIPEINKLDPPSPVDPDVDDVFAPSLDLNQINDDTLEISPSALFEKNSPFMLDMRRNEFLLGNKRV